MSISGLQPKDVDGFHNHAARDPEATAVIEPDGAVWTRGRLLNLSNQIGRALDYCGVGSGEAIAILAPNCAEFLAAYLATGQSGRYFVPVNWHLSGPEIAWILRRSGASAIFVHEKLAGVWAAVARESDPLPNVRIAIGRIDGFLSLAQVLSKVTDLPPERLVGGRIMFFTSATTGRPSAVLQSLEGAPLAPIRTIRFARAVEGVPNVHLCSTMLYHGAGLHHALTAMHLGDQLVLMDTWQPADMLRKIEVHGVTTTIVVPAMLARLLEERNRAGSQFETSSLLQVIHGAAPIPEAVKRAAIEWLGPIFWDCYNGSEGQGTVASTQDWLRYPGTVGRPFQGGEVRILDEGGEQVGLNIVGRVYLRDMPTCRFEYKDEPEKTRCNRRGDFFTMGDLGYVNEEGYLFLTDREADVINCGGQKIYPSEIEQLLRADPEVADCAAFGVEDRVFGQIPAAAIVAANAAAAGPVMAGRILGRMRGQIAAWKWPRRFIFLHELPRAANGKLYRRLLREGVTSDGEKGKAWTSP
jgi:long-chain acyl-CoA synthetase